MPSWAWHRRGTWDVSWTCRTAGGGRWVGGASRPSPLRHLAAAARRAGGAAVALDGTRGGSGWLRPTAAPRRRRHILGPCACGGSLGERAVHCTPRDLGSASGLSPAIRQARWSRKRGELVEREFIRRVRVSYTA